MSNVSSSSCSADRRESRFFFFFFLFFFRLSIDESSRSVHVPDTPVHATGDDRVLGGIRRDPPP
jgi:hypothetical protein